MIENEVDLLLRDFVVKLSYSGLSLDKYLEYNDLKIEDMRERFKDTAKENVKRNLVLDAIAKAENIQADDEEVEKSIKDIAKSNNKPVEEIKQNIGDEQLKYIKESVIIGKVVDFLIESSTIKIKSKTTSDLLEEQEDVELEGSAE